MSIDGTLNYNRTNSSFEKARLKSYIPKPVPNPEAELIPQESPIWNNEALKSLLLNRELKYQVREVISPRTHGQGQDVDLVQQLQILTDYLANLTRDVGSSELIYFKTYVQRKHNIELKCKQRDMMTENEEKQKLLKQIILEIKSNENELLMNLQTASHRLISTLDFLYEMLHQTEITSSPKVALLFDEHMNVLQALRSITWVNTMLSPGLRILANILNLEAETPNISISGYRRRERRVREFLESIITRVNLDNYECFLEPFFAVTKALDIEPSNKMTVVALAAILSCNINEDRGLVASIVEYLTISVTHRVDSKRHFNGMFPIGYMLECFKTVSTQPIDSFKLNICKCLMILGSVNTRSYNEVTKFQTWLNNDLTPYLSILLTWLERIFANEDIPRSLHLKMCQQFFNARTLKQFMINLKKILLRSSPDLNDIKAIKICSFLSEFVTSFDPATSLRESSVLVSFFKDDDFMVLNFLVEAYSKLEVEMRDRKNRFVGKFTILETASTEKQVLASVLEDVDLNYTKMRFDDYATVKKLYKDDLDLFDQLCRPDPLIPSFQRFLIFARISALLFWLAKEDIECNDLIKDDIQDLVTPIRTLGKFLVFDRIRNIFPNETVDYDSWIGFAENHQSASSNDFFSSTSSKETAYDIEFFNNTDFNPNDHKLGFRFLELIGELSNISDGLKHLV